MALNRIPNSYIRRLTPSQLKVLIELWGCQDDWMFLTGRKDAVHRLVAYGYAVEKRCGQLAKGPVVAHQITSEGKLRLLDPEKLIRET